MDRLRNLLPVLTLFCVMVSILAACSTQKNTGMSRWYHGFTARYNTYYNGSLAYIEGSLAKETGNKDNYTEFLPLYYVGNKSSREIGKSSFETAVTKSQKAIKQHSIKRRPEWTKNRRKTERDIEWLSRREYNPFLWKAWMLMGRSQFHMGAFDEAATTFSYMSRLYRTQPAIYGKARAWLAKCYIEQDMLYDAEDVIRNMHRDSIDYHAQKEWDLTMADYHLHTGNLTEATDYLRKVISKEMRGRQRAREYFLLGQILAAQHRNDEAYKAFTKCVRQNPPYELEFNARIAMTEVMPQGSAKAKMSKLLRMAHSDKNKEYLDQVYYAIGNVWLAERDTMRAIYAYEQGNEKATRSGIEKGVLLLHLGDLYWQKEKFGDAQRCYGQAIGLLDKDRPDYEELSSRSKILDELAPYTDAIYLQDSLQALARMDERSRNAAIDRVIDALKKKEKEERLAELEKETQQNAARGNANGGNNNNRGTQPKTPAGGMPPSSTWYFYNPQAVQQGKQTFLQQWGQRENADHWQRANKTVVAMPDADVADSADAAADSISAAQNSDADDKKKKKDGDGESPELDPHNREYYLAQIPFTDEQLQQSNATIADGLYHSAVIFQDKLDNLALSEKRFVRLTGSFPDFEQNEDVFYHLFLLYSRKGDTAKAETYRKRLTDAYPEGEWSQLINDPHFVENARYGVHREDSIYAETYDAFIADNHALVARNCSVSEQRYPKGAHRDKFLLVGGLSRLNEGDADSCLNAMNRIVTDYPQSEVAPLAGMIINGVRSGKRLHSAKFDIADVWNYRSEMLSEDADTTEVAFSDDAAQDFLFLMTYHPDSIESENKLLFEIARNNFTSYLVRNFNIDIDDFAGMHRLIVSGFRNFDEALVYARQLYQNQRVMELARGCRNIIISTANLELLGTRLSYNDYDAFYAEHFEALPPPDEFLLNEQDISPEVYDPETQPQAPSAPVITAPVVTPKPVEQKPAEQAKPKEQAKPTEQKKPVEQKKQETKPSEQKKQAEQKKQEVQKVDDEYFEFDGF